MPLTGFSANVVLSSQCWLPTRFAQTLIDASGEQNKQGDSGSPTASHTKPVGSRIFRCFRVCIFPLRPLFFWCERGLSAFSAWSSQLFGFEPLISKIRPTGFKTRPALGDRVICPPFTKPPPFIQPRLRRFDLPEKTPLPKRSPFLKVKVIRRSDVYLNSVQQMVSGELAGEGLQTGFSRHGLPPQRAPLDTVYPLREHLNSVQRMVSGGHCEGLFPDTVCWTRLRNTWAMLRSKITQQT